MNNKGISTRQAITAILVIVVVLVTVYFSLNFVFYAPYRPYGATITPIIYSNEYNIGVLNEMSTFEIYMWNEGFSPINMEIVLTVEDELITSKIVSIDQNSSRTETVSQRLSDIGMWKVRVVTEEGETIESYSFLTLTNKSEASLKIEELQNAHNAAIYDLIKLILATVTPTIAIGGTIWAIYKYMKNKKKNKEEQITYALIDKGIL